MIVLRGRNAPAGALRVAEGGPRTDPAGGSRVPHVAPTPSKGIRVLHVLAPAREGGLEQVVAMLSSGRRREDVHVAAVLSPSDAESHPFIDKLHALEVPVTRVVVRGRSYVSEYRSLRALMRRLRPAIVHTHGYRADILAGVAARACGVPTVSTVHGFTGGGARNLLYEGMQGLALRRADAVVAVSKPLASRLADSGIAPGRIHFIPNGFCPSENQLTRDEARDRLGLSRQGHVAGWVGRLSREKGADVMVQALAKCDSSWRLSIIGTGRERDRLVDLAQRLGISERISWHGPIPGAASLLRAFDAFVLSSRTEGTPIGLLEAMHAGIPVIATRVGGVPDVVTATDALLVVAESPDAIAGGLAEIAQDQSAAARRAESARRRVADAFGFAPWLAAVDAIYHAVRA
jgi:glycosyltransferase involved in cell wall biosynthesis